MTLEIADCVIALFISLFFTVLTTRMWQHVLMRAWLKVFEAEAKVVGQFALGIGVVAVGTGPSVEGRVGLGLLFFFSIFIILVSVKIMSFLLLLFYLLLDLSARVEFLDPSLHTAQMERLEALPAIPQR